jgi:hypothetical protein
MTLDNALADGRCDRFQFGVDAKFVQNMLDVVPHGVEAEVNLPGQRLVGHADRDQSRLL